MKQKQLRNKGIKSDLSFDFISFFSCFRFVFHFLCQINETVEKILMWRLVRGNVLGFSVMFKDTHIWLQITLGNQMLGESGFPL